MTKARNLRREVSAELTCRGYRRVDRMHLLHVWGEWHFWVDTGPLGKRADISPYVGIRCDVLERTLSELISLPPDETVGSLGANVGYILGGEYRQWSGDASSTEVLGAIDTAFERLRPLMELDRLAEGWRIEATRDPLWRYREITLLLLLNNPVQVQAKLLLAQQEFCRYNDSMASQFREFERRILTRLEISK